VNQEVF